MFRLFLTLFLVVFSGLFAQKSFAQEVSFMPIITNYKPSSYGADLQNWSCSQDYNGVMYFGNNAGLLSFDGYEWVLNTIPGNSVARSVLADGDKIYVGSYTDFGYFKHNKYGSLTYTSLWPRDYTPHNDEIWKIIKPSNGHIYFQSFCSWFDYDGRKVTAHYNKDVLPLHFFNVNGNIYAQMINAGVCLLQNGKFIPMFSREDFGGDDIAGCVPLNNKLLLFITVRNGIFTYDGHTLTHLKTPIDNDLKVYLVNKVISTNGSTLVIGTLLNGIYAINIHTKKLLWHYNMESGLRNNTILGLINDKDNNIWATLDGGIALIHSGLPITIMNTNKLHQPIGMVYGVIKSPDNMYIATNQAVWNYNETTGNLTQINGMNGQNWYINSFDNQILAGNNLFTSFIYGNSFRPVTSNNVGSTCIRRYTGYGQDMLLEATYSGFRVYDKVNGAWTFSHEVEGFQAPILEFEIDNAGTIWATHISKGLYKLKLSKDLSHVTSKRYYAALTPNGTPSLIHVTNVMGRTIFSYANKIYTYDDIRHAIVEYKELGRLLPQGFISSAQVDNHTFWMSDANGYSLIRREDKGYYRLRFIPYDMFGLEANVKTLSQYVSGNYTYFFLNNGVGRCLTEIGNTANIVHPLTITSVTYINSRNETKRLALADGNYNMVKGDNISITYSYPNFNNRQLLFSFTIKGNGKTITTQSDKPFVSFNSLGYGDYEVIATVSLSNGVELARATYSFRHATPLYLSLWAFIVYAVAFVLIIRAYVIWRTKRAIIISRREAEEKLIRQSIKSLEQKQIIAAQKQQLMEQELSAKGAELATMALHDIKRNNSNEMLKEELLEKRRNGKLELRDFKKLITLMDAGNDDDVWMMFQQNFDLIHKHFFRDLRRRYPELTSTDLKFCALLRLNLNTKDIAKFTNLTVRGVEGARYRLRKKLRINSDKSLTDFLIDLE